MENTIQDELAIENEYYAYLRAKNLPTNASEPRLTQEESLSFIIELANNRRVISFLGQYRYVELARVPFSEKIDRFFGKLQDGYAATSTGIRHFSKVDYGGAEGIRFDLPIPKEKLLNDLQLIEILTEISSKKAVIDCFMHPQFEGSSTINHETGK